MKKFVCILLVLMMVSVSAMAAEFVPSKTTGDLTQFVVKSETAANLVVRPVAADEVEYEKNVEVCNAQIEKLVAAENVVTYFGEVKNAEGEVIDICEVLGVETVNVFEFCPFIATGYEEEMGDVVMTLQFSTPYEVDETVIVLVGLVAEDETIEWTAYEGVVTEEGVEVEFAAETLAAIQEGTAILAVASK